MRGPLIAGLIVGLFIWAPIFFRWGQLHERNEWLGRQMTREWLARHRTRGAQ